MESGGNGMRIARASVLGYACLLLAVAGHVCGGGDLPPLPVLLITGVLIAVTFAVLADRYRNWVQLTAASAGAQLVGHLAFALECHDHTALIPGPRRLALLVAATVALAVLASHADRLLWSLIGLLCDVLLPKLLAVPVPAVSSLPPSVPTPALPRPLLDSRSIPRRGPPRQR